MPVEDTYTVTGRMSSTLTSYPTSSSTCRGRSGLLCYRVGTQPSCPSVDWGSLRARGMVLYVCGAISQLCKPH